MMKIIFFGEDSFSNVVLQSLLEAKFDVVFVVSPVYDNLVHKRLEKTCSLNHIEYRRVADLKEQVFMKKLNPLSPDLIVITYFEKLIPKEIINIPRYGCINVHPSLLPYHRGLSPHHWPIINGDRETGVSVHFIDESADTGDIILQKKIPITPGMYVSDLQLEFIKVYKTIVIEAISLLRQPGFTPMKQSHLKGTYYGKLKREQCRIDLSESRNQVINLIRGVSKPYYGAHLDGIIIWRARIADSSEDNTLRKVAKNKIGFNLSDSGKPYLLLKDGGIIIEKYERIR